MEARVLVRNMIEIKDGDKEFIIMVPENTNELDVYRALISLCANLLTSIKSQQNKLEEEVPKEDKEPVKNPE